MRYRIIDFLAYRLPHRLWMRIPESWRDEWSREWVRRDLAERYPE